MELLFSWFTCSEEELMKKYECSRSTITRKKREIRNFSDKVLKTIIGGDYTVCFKLSLGNSVGRLEDLFEMRKNSTDPQEKLEIMKSERAEEEHFFKILKEGPVADALEKLGGRQDE